MCVTRMPKVGKSMFQLFLMTHLPSMYLDVKDTGYYCVAHAKNSKNASSITIVHKPGTPQSKVVFTDLIVQLREDST